MEPLLIAVNLPIPEPIPQYRLIISNYLSREHLRRCRNTCDVPLSQHSAGQLRLSNAITLYIRPGQSSDPTIRS